MKTIGTAAAAAFAAFALIPLLAVPALADTYLGSYVARLSQQDHHASDGYALDTAAQVVRQDRAYWHRFGYGDPEDEDDPWFATAQARARFEQLLNQSGSMNGATRQAIFNGAPLVKVDVYRNSVRVTILGY